MGPEVAGIEAAVEFESEEREAAGCDAWEPAPEISRDLTGRVARAR